MIDRDEVARRLRAGMDDKGRQVTTAWWLDWMVMGTDRDSNGNLWSTAATLGRLAELIESAPMDRCTADWCEIEQELRKG